ncbi:MAG: histidine kinase [Clostridiaceae bacterium]|nr:histidine kinase [Clostridiaceae bacterium]
MKLIKTVWLPALLILLMMTGCRGKEENKRKLEAQNGVLDLSGWNFNADGNASLDGDWEFYWDALISPGEFSGRTPTGYFRLPSGWAKYKILDLPDSGTATYRLVAETEAADGVYGISIPNVYTQYALWVNGSLLAACGSFAGAKTTYLHPQSYDFYYSGSELEIVLQVKNDDLAYGGGVGQSIRLGTAAMISREQNKQEFVDISLICISLFAGGYVLVLHHFRKDNNELISLSVLCGSVALRSMLSNTTLMMQMYPELPFLVGSRLVMLTIPAIIISMLYYTRQLYRKLMPRPAFLIILSMNVMYIAVVLLFPPTIYTAAFLPYLPTVAAACVLGLYVSVKAVRLREKEADFFLLGMLILTLGAMLDSLVYISVISVRYMLPAALFGFILVQSVLLAKRYSEAFRHMKLLSDDLSASLDKVMNTETALFNAQIKPHFIYNALNTIAECCGRDAEAAERLIISLSKYLRGTLDFENLGGIISLRKELELVRAYASIEEARFENIKVEFDISDPPPYIRLPPLTLQPLVENAIKHGLRRTKNGGIVTLKAEASDNGILFSVEDDGAGIPQEKLNLLLDKPKGNASIGLYNINMRLLRLYGKGLCIQSVVGAGTRVSFEIPIGEACVCSEQS